MAGGYLNTAANTPGLFVGADPDWQLKQQQVDATDTFRGGLPTDASGNVDYNAAAKALLQKGAFGPAKDFIGVGMQQQAIKAGMDAANDLGGGSAGTSPAQPSGPMSVFQKAISDVESGGKYDALGPQTQTGDRAYGKYQVMGANVPQWTQEVLGKPMTPEQFLASPEAQDAVFNAKFGGYLKQGGNPRDAASMWFTGKPYAQGAGAQDQLGTSGAQYVTKFLAGLPRGGQASPQAPQAPAAPAPGGPVARTSTGQPVQTDAQGRAIDPRTGQPTQAQPVQVAQNGASDAPSNIHPYAPVATPSSGAPPQPPQPAAPSAPAPQGQPVSPAASASPQGQTNPSSSLLDPTLGGLLKGQWVGNPGGYVSALRAQAVRLGTLGNTSASNAYNKQADAVERGIERNNIVTTEMKNYEIARQQGFTGSMMDYARALEVQKQAAEGDPTVLRAKGQSAAATAAGSEQGKTPYELVPTQPTPGGPTVLVPKAQILAGDQPVVSKQPAVFAQKQEALVKPEAEMMDQMQQRQIARERIGAMTNLLETFQSGAGADQKAAAVAAVRALGYNLPDSATANPAAVEQFSKNTTANIFSQAKALGGKVLVSELAGLQKSNANPNMQPASNGAILAQQKGLLDWQDAHDHAYFDWKRSNPNAFDPSSFEQEWMKTNPVSAYVEAARKDIAPLGAPLPPKSQLVDGQAYMIKGQKARWSAAANGFVPVAAH